MCQNAVNKQFKKHAGAAHEQCGEVPLDAHAHQLFLTSCGRKPQVYCNRNITPAVSAKNGALGFSTISVAANIRASSSSVKMYG